MSQVENVTLSIYSWCTTSTLHAIHQRKDVHTLTDTKLKTKCWNQSIGPHGIEGQTTSAWTGSRIIHTWPIIYRCCGARWTMLNWLFKAAQLQEIIITCLCSASWGSCRTKIRHVGVAGYDVTPGWFRFVEPPGTHLNKNMTTTVVKIGDFPFFPQKMFGFQKSFGKILPRPTPRRSQVMAACGAGYSAHNSGDSSEPSKMRRHFTSRSCFEPPRGAEAEADTRVGFQRPKWHLFWRKKIREEKSNPQDLGMISSWDFRILSHQFQYPGNNQGKKREYYTDTA